MWDSHCHLQLDPLFDQADELLAKAKKIGVVGCLVPSYDQAGWARQSDLLRLDGVVCALGMHPWCVPDANLDELRARLREAFECFPKEWGDRLVAVGEFGLDRSTPQLKNCFESQKVLFSDHLVYANDHFLPVVVHLVRAAGMGYDLLSQSPPVAGGVLHGYSCSAEMIPRFAELGLSFSYSQRLGDSEKFRQSLCSTPTELILFETDAPFSKVGNGVGHSGPHELVQVLDLASEILGRSREWCRTVHLENWARIFGQSPR